MLFKDKRGILPRNLIVIVVIIGMLVTASAFWIDAWEDKYNPVESSNLSSSYNQISQVTTDVNSMEGKLRDKTDVTGIGFLDFFIQGGYNVLLAVLSIPSILTGFAEDAGAMFNIPRVYIDGLVVLIIVGAIFGIIGSIFRRKT